MTMPTTLLNMFQSCFASVGPAFRAESIMSTPAIDCTFVQSQESPLRRRNPVWCSWERASNGLTSLEFGAEQCSAQDELAAQVGDWRQVGSLPRDARCSSLRARGLLLA